MSTQAEHDAMIAELAEAQQAAMDALGAAPDGTEEPTVTVRGADGQPQQVPISAIDELLAEHVRTINGKRAFRRTFKGIISYRTARRLTPIHRGGRS